MWLRLPQKKKRMWSRPQQKKKNMSQGFPQKKKKRVGTPSKEKEYMAGLPQLNDDMVGTLTRKGLGFQQIYGVTNLISKHERGENLVLHCYLHG